MASVFFDPNLGGNGTTVSDDADPATGLRRTGYLTRFVPALQQFVALVSFSKTKAQESATSATNAANSAASALVERNLAVTAKNDAIQAQIASESARDAAQGFATLAQATNPLAALQINRNVITENQTLPSGFNALSAGPIEIKSGVTVVIEENSTWSIA